MKKFILASIAFVAVFQLNAQGFKTRKDSVSYALGVTMAETLKKSGISDYNEDLVKKAISEHLKGKGAFDAMTADKIYKEEARKLPIKRLSKRRKRAKHFWQKTKRANSSKLHLQAFNTSTRKKVPEQCPTAMIRLLFTTTACSSMEQYSTALCSAERLPLLALTR